MFKKDTLNSLGDVYDAAYYGCVDIQEKAKELSGQEIEALDENAHWLIENEAEFFGAQYKELFSDLDDIKKLLEAIIEKEDDGYTHTYNDSIGHMYEDNENKGVAIWNGTQGIIDENGIFTSTDGSYTIDTNTGKVVSHRYSKG